MGALALPLVLLARLLAYPVHARQERIRWLSEASGPDSPIYRVPDLSDAAKHVYIYIAGVTLRFGSSHSRIRTIAHVAGVPEHQAREAIRELERRGLLRHEKRNTWHGRGAYAYFVRPMRLERAPDQRSEMEES